MNREAFQPMDRISVKVYLHTSRTAFDNIYIHKGAVMWLLSFYMTKQAAPASSARSSSIAKSSLYSVKAGILTMYCYVVNPLLEMGSTPDIM